MAAEEQNTELLPLLDSDDPFFDVGLRGYDKHQVDDYVARTLVQLAELAAARDEALATSADRAAQLASRDAHIESLRQQATKSSETLNAATVSDRIHEMLQLATEEAAQTRRAAEQEAERVLVAAHADAERLRADAAAEQQRLNASATQRSAEADQKLAQARTQASSELDKARNEAARLTEAARAERDRLDAAAAAARLAEEQQVTARLKAAEQEVTARLDAAEKAVANRLATAEQDFEITLRARRTAAEQQAALERANVQAAADKLIADARDRAAALAAEQARTHEQLRELHARLGKVVDGVNGT